MKFRRTAESSSQSHGGKEIVADANFGRHRDNYNHVIVLVHGIRDIGAWQSKISRCLEHPGTTIKQVRYGLYPAVRFLFPINLSAGPVRKVMEALSDIRNEYREARISVIAHSFGTYVVLKALEQDPNLELWKLVLCGSVANDQFRWSGLKRKIGDGDRPTSDFIVNDCGTGDIWPVLGSAFGWFYGMAGATGFSEVFVKNRFHRSKGGASGGHGLYFDPDFVREKWRPFLINDAEPIPGDGEQGEHLNWWVRLLYHGWARWICRFVMLLFWLSIVGATGCGIWFMAAWSIKLLGRSTQPNLPNAGAFLDASKSPTPRNTISAADLPSHLGTIGVPYRFDPDRIVMPVPVNCPNSEAESLVEQFQKLKLSYLDFYPALEGKSISGKDRLNALNKERTRRHCSPLPNPPIVLYVFRVNDCSNSASLLIRVRENVEGNWFARVFVVAAGATTPDLPKDGLLTPRASTMNIPLHEGSNSICIVLASIDAYADKIMDTRNVDLLTFVERSIVPTTLAHR